jgi:hypothetical protein
VLSETKRSGSDEAEVYHQVSELSREFFGCPKYAFKLIDRPRLAVLYSPAVLDFATFVPAWKDIDQ